MPDVRPDRVRRLETRLKNLRNRFETTRRNNRLDEIRRIAKEDAELLESLLIPEEKNELSADTEQTDKSKDI